MQRFFLWLLLALTIQNGSSFLPVHVVHVGRSFTGIFQFRDLKKKTSSSTTAGRNAVSVRCNMDSGADVDNSKVEKFSNAALDVPDSATIEFADNLGKRLESMFGTDRGDFWGTKFYSDEVRFEDPLVQVSGLPNFKRIHSMLNDSAILTDSRMQVHDVVAAGKGRVRARFTLTQTVKLLPWRPKIEFTGVSTLWINSDGLVTKHVDKWDSVSNDGMILLDALRDIAGPCGVWKPGASPLDSPEITLLRRDKDFMIKKISPYKCAEVAFDKKSKNAALKALNGYLNGANAAGKMLSETTPMMICYEDETGAGLKYVSNIMPKEYRTGKKEPPMPTERQTVSISSRQGGTFAVAKLDTQIDPVDGGWVSAESVFDAKAKLRDVMVREGMTAGKGWRLARYQDVYGKGGNVYELWIPVESFQLRAAPLISAAEEGFKLPGIKLDFKSLDGDKSEDQDDTPL